MDHTYRTTSRTARRRGLAAWSGLLPARKTIILLLVLLLGLGGYLLAPADPQPGAYAAQINVSVNGQPLQVALPFTLGREAGEPVAVTTTAGAYTLTVEGYDAYRLGPSQPVTYRLQVTDRNGHSLYIPQQDVSSTISGQRYTQSLPPTGRDGDWLTFSMRLPFKARIATALLFAVALLWVTELVPLAAAALLIPVVVVVSGITDADTVLQPFFHPIVALFFAGFLLAEAMRRTAVDRLLALNILRRASLKPAFLMLTMMSLTAFLSMWMSNTAAAAIVIPIALAVLDRIPEAEGRTGYRRALILGIAYSATIGGIGSAIGTPANILAMTFLNDLAGTTLGFADWFGYGLPVVLIMLPVVWLYLLLAFRVRFRGSDSHISRDVYDGELKQPLRKEQIIVLLVFVAIVALWLTDRWHQIDTGIVALGGVLLLFLTGTVQKEDLNVINWNALLTFGGGLALGNVLVMTGVSDWVALQLTGLVVLPPLFVIFLVAGLTLLIGAFISNTACAAMLIPLAIPLAQILHMDPRLLVVIIAIASSIDFALVVGTPPTMMAYATGHFQAQDIFKRGILLDLLGVLILSFGIIWLWRLLGLVAF